MRAVKLQQVKPGKGGAFAQIELKDIRDGTKMNERFRSDETVERVRLDQVDYQYLFADGEMLTFMNNDTFEQIELNSDLVGEPLPFLQENMQVTIELYEEEPISVSLPESVILEITEADAVVKGLSRELRRAPVVLVVDADKLRLGVVLFSFLRRVQRVEVLAKPFQTRVGNVRERVA